MTIEDEDAYDAALAEAAVLMDAEAETPEGMRLDKIVTAIEAYEARRWPMTRKSGTNKSAADSGYKERIRTGIDELARGEVVSFEEVFGEPL
jgi:antitoxin component HigA of HigAB toxin-antitoxin module